MLLRPRCLTVRKATPSKTWRAVLMSWSAIVAALAPPMLVPNVALGQSILPTGGNVVAGSARIGPAVGGALTIVQSSPNAVINWSTFSVGKPNTVMFEQPGAASAVLNRVTGDTPSTIVGMIRGNGQVYLVNPNGIAITPTGVVRVDGGFVASTLDLAADAFMAGKRTLTGGGASASVTNAGTIATARGGYVALIGGTVASTGTINVPVGRVGLASGEQVTIDPTGDGFLQVAVPTSAMTGSGRALIDVTGKITAAGGVVELKAATVAQAVRDAVNVSGSIAARSVSGRNGTIVLDGGSGGNVTVSGALAASGGNRAAGGTVVATGRSVKITSSATLDASGTTGGNVLIGGDLRGGFDPAARLLRLPVRDAQTTTVEQGATVKADGTSGAGGSVVLWSDAFTSFRGTITANGAGAGAGGAVEVSSHGVLDYAGTVDVRAASGRTGTLLLDPFDVTISTGADTGACCTATSTNTVINTTTLENALLSANVTVSTGSGGPEAGDITVANAVTWASGNALTLNAANAINVNAPITATNGGSLTMTGTTIAVTGTTITTSGTLSATATASGATNAVTLTNATIDVGTGSGTIAGTTSTGYGVSFSGTSSLTAGGGTLTVSGTNTSGVAGMSVNGAGVTTSGTVTLNGSSGGSQGINITNGTVADTSGNLTLNGASNSNEGVSFAGTNSVNNSGVGTLALSGTSSSGRGLLVNSGTSLTTSGDMTMAGTSASDIGAWFLAGLTVSSGSLTATGTSTSGSGLKFTGTISATNSGAGPVVFQGTSGSGGGLVLDAGASLTTAGSMTLAGTSTNAAGVRFDANSTLTASSGNLIVTGNSSSGAGAEVTGTNSLTNGGAGTLSVSGTSSTGDGMALDASVSLTTAGTMTLSGTSTSASGVHFFGTNTLTDSSGALTVTGTSTSGAGTLFAGSSSVTNAGAGMMTIAGSSASAIDAGLELSTGAGLTSAGPVTLSGSQTNYIGLYFQATNTLVDASGDLTLNGTSVSDAGLQWRGSQIITNSGAGTLSYNGTSTTYRGLDFFGNASFTFSGDATLSGTSTSGNAAQFGSNTLNISSGNVAISGTSTSGGGAVVAGANSFTNSGSGSLSLGGTSTTGPGLKFFGTATLTTSGTVALAGTSNSNFGSAFAGSNTLTASSGDLTFSGSSSSSLGMELLGTSSIINNGSGTLALNTVGGIDLNASISSPSGPLVLSGSGSVIQSAGTIAAANLLLSGASGNFTLNAAGNAIGTVAANAGSVALNDNSALATGTVLGTSGVTASGNLTLTTNGSLTIALGAPVNGASPVLAAAGAFINNAGSGAVTASSGRWLIYSSAPGSDTFGSLDSANTALWNATYTSLPPASVTASGNRYLFANQPTLTFTSTNASKTYGTDATAAITGNYTISGLQAGIANAFQGDIAATAYSGAPSVTSAGAGAAATVAGSPYALTVAAGTLTSPSGYGFVFQSNGALTVNPKALTVTASNTSKTYGSTLAFAGTELTTSGLVNGDSVTSATLASAGAAATATVTGSPYAITATNAIGSGLSNYAIGYVNGALTVNPKALTVTANNGSKTYGSTFTFAGIEFTTSGLVNGDSVTAASLASAGAAATATVAGSPYAITASSASGSGLANYAISYVPGSLTVDPASVTVTALGGSSTYGSSPANPGLSATGLQNGQDASVLTGLRNSFGIISTTGAGSYAMNVAGALTNPNYTVIGTRTGTWTVAALRGPVGSNPTGSTPTGSTPTGSNPPGSAPTTPIPGPLTPPANDGSGVLNGLSNLSSLVNTDKSHGSRPDSGESNGTRNPAVPKPDNDTPRGPPAQTRVPPEPIAPPAGASASSCSDERTGDANQAFARVPGGSSDGQSPGCAPKTVKKAAGLIDFALSKLNRDALAKALDRELARLADSNASGLTTLTKVVAGTGAVFTAAAVGWFLRGGALLSALLSTMPLWRQFDPLAIVLRSRRRDEQDEPPSRVDRMFDDARGFQPLTRGRS
jgi:filamentous hemagglutinin family protein